MLTRFRQVYAWAPALAFVAGAAMPFAYSPYALRWLVLPALAIFYLALRHGARPAWTGFAFGLGWFGTGAWWLAPTLHTYGHLAWPLAGLCVLLVGAVLACLPAFWGWLAVRCAGTGPWLMLGFAPGAGLEEWLRGHVLTGLPWTAIGNTLLDSPAIGWGSVLGVHALAMLPALAAAALVELMHRSGRKAGVTALLFAACIFLLAPQPDAPPTASKMRSVALIQGNIPQDVKWDAAFLNETMQRYAMLSSKARADLLIWPEAAVPFFLSRSSSWQQWLEDRVNRWQVPLLFGGLKDLGGGIGQNGLYAALPQHRYAAWEFAGKQHLVPFGEYVPSWLPFLHTLVPEIADFRPATGNGILSMADIRAGSLICYESLFPEISRARVLAGANVLVNVTNDAWYGRSPAAWQHLEAARMRAVETGRFVLRAANTGVTAIIAPDGTVRQALPWWTADLLQGSFQLRSQITPYVRWGDWPLLGALLILPVVMMRRKWCEA